MRLQRQGSLGGGWDTVRRRLGVIGIVAAVLCAAAPVAVAGEPDVPGARILHMQTAFNPGLPGAGEGVRVFAKTLKQMSGGGAHHQDRRARPHRPDQGHAGRRDRRRPRSRLHLDGLCRLQGRRCSACSAQCRSGPGPSVMASWLLDGDGGRIHHDAYDKLGVTGIPCGVQGSKGGGWFRADLNTPEDFKGVKLRYGQIAGDVVARMGATLAPLPAGEFFYHLQQGKVDGGEMSTPAMDAALGFDKLGLPYYLPGWQQPSAVIDFLMRKDKWEALPAASAPRSRPPAAPTSPGC